MISILYIIIIEQHHVDTLPYAESHLRQIKQAVHKYPSGWVPPSALNEQLKMVLLLVQDTWANVKKRKRKKKGSLKKKKRRVGGKISAPLWQLLETSSHVSNWALVCCRQQSLAIGMYQDRTLHSAERTCLHRPVRAGRRCNGTCATLLTELKGGAEAVVDGFNGRSLHTQLHFAVQPEWQAGQLTDCERGLDVLYIYIYISGQVLSSLSHLCLVFLSESDGFCASRTLGFIEMCMWLGDITVFH